MRRLSPGVLASAQTLLEMLQRQRIEVQDLKVFYPTWFVAETKYVLDTSLFCNWVSIGEDKNLDLTEQGKLLLREPDVVKRLRMQIEDYIRLEMPEWAPLIPRGRQETLAFIPADARQCFVEADLASKPPSEETVLWWDRLAALARGERQDSLVSIGRRGEAMSVRYEERRTGRIPEWQSVESNLSGFDLISVVSDTIISPVLIEVKTSTIEEFALSVFYVSRNEWEIALSSTNYVFHLWLVTKTEKARLAVVDKQRMSEHIPVDQREGTWQSTKIPFNAFADLFKDVSE